PMIATRRASLWAALGIVAVLVPAILTIRPGRFEPRTDWQRREKRHELSQLVIAFERDAARTVEGRLTGGFRYAPMLSNTRGDPITALGPAVRVEAARIEQRTAGDDPSSAHAALGTPLLVQGQVTRAVNILEDAISVDPANPWIQNDLAVAYIARATEQDRPDDLPRAVVAAERALKSDPALEEAWFNRALALDK